MALHNVNTSIPYALANERQAIISDIVYLLGHVAPEHKTSIVKVLIRKNHKFDIARGLLEGDEYYKWFLASPDNQLDDDQLCTLRERILNELSRNMHSSQQTANAVNYIVANKTTPTATSVIEDAYNTIGNIFARTLQDEEDRQYNLANNTDPNRALEERELKLCGNPYAELLRNNLPLLRKYDGGEFAKFNSVIRRLLLKYQDKNSNMSMLDLQVRLRYTLKKLADVLDIRGFSDVSMDIRAKVFGHEYTGYGAVESLRSAGKDKQKSRPIITEEMKERSNAFLQYILRDAKKLLHLFGKHKESESTSDELQKQISDVVQAHNATNDPEALRKLGLRLAKVHDAYLRLQLEQVASDGIKEDDVVRTLPINEADLTFAYKTHLEKLRSRTKPAIGQEKSYYPKKETSLAWN